MGARDDHHKIDRTTLGAVVVALKSWNTSIGRTLGQAPRRGTPCVYGSGCPLQFVSRHALHIRTKKNGACFAGVCTRRIGLSVADVVNPRMEKRGHRPKSACPDSVLPVSPIRGRQSTDIGGLYELGDACCLVSRHSLHRVSRHPLQFVSGHALHIRTKKNGACLAGVCTRRIGLSVADVVNPRMEKRGHRPKSVCPIGHCPCPPFVVGNRLTSGVFTNWATRASPLHRYPPDKTGMAVPGRSMGTVPLVGVTVIGGHLRTST